MHVSSRIQFLTPIYDRHEHAVGSNQHPWQPQVVSKCLLCDFHHGNPCQCTVIKHEHLRAVNVHLYLSTEQYTAAAGRCRSYNERQRGQANGLRNTLSYIVQMTQVKARKQGDAAR